MKKWSLLLVVMLLIASIAVTAQAATVPEDVTWIELDSKEVFLEWFNGTSKSKHLTDNYTAGMTRYYKLTEDITLDVNSTVYYLSSGTNQVNTYIDLNGHTLTYDSPSNPATRLFGSYNASTTQTFVNGTIDNKSHIATSNGGLFLMNKGALVMEDVVIKDTDDTAFGYSGKIISAVGYDVTLINVDIHTGTSKACNYGLAVRCENATLTLTNCNFTGNSTARVTYGGYVYQKGGTLNITNCTFANGFGKYGGNVFADGAATTITDSTFTGGRSETGGQGGSFCQWNGTASITGCEFIGGTTTPDFGGSVFLQGTEATLKDCTFTGGKAKYGGAFYTVNKPVTMENCTLSGGQATADGGNIQAKNGSFTLINTDVTGGKATSSGGNISVANSVKFYFKSGTISGGSAKNGGNIATSIGGTVGPTLNFEGMTITGGNATGNGGNLYVVANAGYAGKPTVNVSSGIITDGTAGESGGNVYLAGLAKETIKNEDGTTTTIAQRNVTFTMTGGTLGGTPAEGKEYAASAKNGGNLYASYAVVNISGGVCSNTHASSYGGNLYPATACTMTISGDALISGGVAESRGGNMYISSTNSVVNIQGGTIQNGLAYGYGGNIYHGNGKMTITGGVITGGYSESSGGNIYVGMGYGNSATHCGALTIKDDGNADTPLAQITNGVAALDGGNIFINCSGNALDTGTNKVVLGKFEISGGDAKSIGDELYMMAYAIVEILPEFSQEIPCYIGHTVEKSMLEGGVYGAAFANGRGISTGDFTGKLVIENHDNTFVYGKDGTLYFAGAATVAEDGTKTWYKTNAEAVAAYADAAYLRAAPGELVLPEGAYVVDIAGQSVAVSGTGSVTCFDSANDSYETFGTATFSGVTLQNTVLSRVLNKDYYMLEQDGAYSFHRVNAQLTSVALRPSMGGIYYTAKWECDDTVKPLIGSYGVAVSMKNFPGADFANDETALWTTFEAADFVSGVQKTGAMIAGILKDATDGATQERIAMNGIYAQMDIFAQAYVTIDGTTYTGIGASYSLYDIMKAVETQINEYYAQASVMQDFMTQWSGKGLVGEPWDSLNFQVSEDVMKLNTLYAGLQPYYGELHDHADTGGTSDGKQPLSVWKSELNRLKMDFATIVDHKQSLHMYLEDWDNNIFIGGSEAATTITDRTGVKLHYNMIFSDPAGLEAVVSSFPEYKWQYYAEDYSGTNAEKLAGGWHFGYPNFTAERFTEVCQAVYDNGGFVALVHPKSVGYISSDDPADAYFMDGIGMEVFYTIWTTRDGWKTKANHKLWTDMMKAGYKVYATAGNDEHDMPSDKACSVIYAPERGAGAWVQQLRKGQFVAGGVGVRSCMGDTMMGGTTSFEGKRFSFSVGDFHASLFDPSHTFRADVYDQNGVVFSGEVSATETTYFAFDADNASNYYYIEIYDVTDDSMIAIGNPIWNEK